MLLVSPVSKYTLRSPPLLESVAHPPASHLNCTDAPLPQTQEPVHG